MNTPINYEEWLLTAGEEKEFGSKVLITDRLLRDAHSELFDSIWKLTRDAFQKVLFDNGVEPITVEFTKERDSSLRASEIYAIVDASQGASLEQYAAVISAQVRDFYGQVRIWESKSLWQYIKWWFQRRKQCTE